MSKKIIIKLLLICVLVAFIVFNQFFKIPDLNEGHKVSYEIVNDFTPEDIIKSGIQVTYVESTSGNYIEVIFNNYKSPALLTCYLVNQSLVIQYNEDKTGEEKDRFIRIYYDHINEVKDVDIIKNKIRQWMIKERKLRLK